MTMLINAFDWNDIRLLLILQREGSLSATAKALGVDVSTIRDYLFEPIRVTKQRKLV